MQLGLNAHLAGADDRRDIAPMIELEEKNLLENILAAEILTLAHVIKSNTTVMDESTNPVDFRAEAIAEIKKNRRDLIAKLVSG
jgi:hypothetical protein